MYPLELSSGIIFTSNSSITLFVIHLKLEVVILPIDISCWRPDTLCSHCVCFHARGIGSSVAVVGHCHPSPDPFLDEQMLMNICEKVQFHVHHFKSSLPRQTTGSLIMGRIRTIILEAHVSKILDYVGQ